MAQIKGVFILFFVIKYIAGWLRYFPTSAGVCAANLLVYIMGDMNDSLMKNTGHSSSKIFQFAQIAANL